MTTEATPQTEQPQQISISIQDLNALANILQVASKRGAFDAKELSVVGGVYDRLADFLSKANPAPETTEAPKE